MKKPRPQRRTSARVKRAPKQKRFSARTRERVVVEDRLPLPAMRLALQTVFGTVPQHVTMNQPPRNPSRQR